MSAQQVIQAYESLAQLSHQMRTAADLGEWDKLITLEHQCAQLVNHLKSTAQTPPPEGVQLERQLQLIKEILADDAEICKRTGNWMSQLQLNMQSNRQEQRINQAYGAT